MLGLSSYIPTFGVDFVSYIHQQCSDPHHLHASVLFLYSPGSCERPAVQRSPRQHRRLCFDICADDCRRNQPDQSQL